MPKRGDLPNKRKFFSLTATTILILSTILVGISIQAPNATAGAPKNHYTGNVKLKMLTDWGRMMGPIRWGTGNSDNGPYQTATRSSGMSFIGLVIDHDYYIHTSGAEDIAECFLTGPDYGGSDDFKKVKDIAMIIDDGTTQKSIASFQNKGAGYPDDIFINQTAWTVLNKDWAIIQWSLKNIKTGVDLTNVSIGLELPLSVAGGSGGVGGDSGDDIDDFDSTNNIYWVQDFNDGGTTIGFASAITAEPITHHYSDICDGYTWNEYAYLYQNETWLYERLRAPNSVVGPTPGNRSSTVGWDNFDMSDGSLKTFTLVIAMGNSFNDMTAAVQDAQNYYHNVASGFRITELSDSGIAPQTPQIEIFNYGRGATDLSGPEYTLFADGAPLTGNWVPPTISTYGYSTFTPNENINAEGATISLKENGLLMDEVSFGQKGVAPDPLDGESVARRFDTTMADYSNEWLRNGSTGTTFGGLNNVGSIIPTPNIVLNRVGFYPWDPAEAYVELMFRFGNGAINNFKVVCDDAVEIPSYTPGLTASNRYYVLNQSDYPALFQNMDSTADNIYLYDANDNLLDMVGWSTAHDQGTYMSRVPDGGGSFQGFDDTSSTAASWVFNNQPSLKITEFYTEPGQVTIEIYNPRGGDIDPDPSHWRLAVDNGVLTGGNWGPPLIPGNKGYSTFTWSGGVTIGDEGDVIMLDYNPSSGWITMDQVEYGTWGVAPDPLSGESTARYWNSANSRYSNDWTREDSPNFGSQNDVLPVNATPWLVLDDVMFNPTAPDGGFIIIMFIGPPPWYLQSIADFILVCDDVFVIPFTNTLYPGDRLIIKYGDDPGLAPLFANMTPNGDNLYLYDPNGVLYDMVGWDTPHLQGMSVARVPHGFGTYQGYDDTTSEAAGWVFNSPLTNVQMTEISDDDSAVAQIEVYNPWYPTINFTNGFTFRSESTGFLFDLAGSWVPPGTANSGEYAVFNLAASGLNPQGDTIRLLQNGIILEEISYGLKGTIPDPLPDESVERYWNGAFYTNVWERNWTTGPNFGGQNNVPPANFTSILLLDEIMFNPSTPQDHFVELFALYGGIDISGYKIVGNTVFTIPAGTIVDIEDQLHYFMYDFNAETQTLFDNLISSGDNLYLYDNNGSLLDMAGWSSLHTQGMTMSRIPEGNGTRDGFDDTSSIAAGWVFDCEPTVQMVKISVNRPNKPKIYGDFGGVIYFNVTIKNKQSVEDTVDISNSTLNGFPVVIYDETGTFIITELTVPPGSSINITVMVVLPSTLPFDAFDNVTITIQSQNVTLFKDSQLLGAYVTPFIWPEKYVTPSDIYLKGTGHDEIATVTLNLTGQGALMELKDPQDVIFAVDVSLSMTQWAIDQIKVGLTGYVDEMEYPDMGAVCLFGEILMGDFWGVRIMNPLTDDYIQLKGDIANIPAPQGNTPIAKAINYSVNELLTNGNPSHIQVIILLTDGQWNDPAPWDPWVEAQNAANHNIRIFTIGLGNNINPPFLQQIAMITNGSYFHAPTPDEIPEIYKLIAAYIGDLAGRDPDPFDAVPMIMDVLPPWIEPLWASFSIPPDTNITNATGYRILGWNLASLGIGKSWEVTFQIKATSIGFFEANNYTASRVYYRDYFDKDIFVLFPKCMINVLPPTPIPPKLYIDILPNKNDIKLYWEETLDLGTEYYLIYNSTDPRNFDFSTPWVNTKIDYDNGIIPLRNSWNITGAAQPGHGNYSEQWYYCIRGVNGLDETSYTSRTVGKWTKEFTQQGVSTFSLPLEPLETMNTTADFYLTDMVADYIKWMDPFFHIWMKHGDGGVNDTQLEVGRGYEVKFSSPTKYTFMGMPGAMIRYNDLGSYLGFDPDSTAKDLSVIPDTPGIGDITLQWSPLGPPTTNYYVYYSTTRDGFHGTKGVHYHEIAILPVGTTSFVHSGVALPNTQYYYMIIPVNVTGAEGASTYSIGVWTEGYLAQYDTLGIPLILTSYPTVDWYCDQMNDVVGINYFMNAEQRWSWHSTRMPTGAFDPVLDITEGYQISTSGISKFTFVGY